MARDVEELRPGQWHPTVGGALEVWRIGGGRVVAPVLAPEPPVRILVTGSRDWPRARATEVRDAIVAVATGHSEVVVVHGACEDRETGKLRGADAWADLTAIRMGYGLERWPADWPGHGLAAGPIRNKAMVAAGAHYAIAFPLGVSKGTRGCMDLCSEAGIPVFVHE
jgi:hypothetical protein